LPSWSISFADSRRSWRIFRREGVKARIRRELSWSIRFLPRETKRHETARRAVAWLQPFDGSDQARPPKLVQPPEGRRPLLPDHDAVAVDDGVDPDGVPKFGDDGVRLLVGGARDYRDFPVVGVVDSGLSVGRRSAPSALR
jgi:hypothetical protein